MTAARLAAFTLTLLGVGLVQAAETGRLDLYVFAPDGRPAAGLRVSSGAVSETTGADGVARLTLPAGEHVVELRDGQRLLASRTLPIAPGEVSEVIVRLQVEGDAQLDVEAPGWPRPTAGAAVAAGALGDVEGVLSNAKDGSPVAGAKVLVRGQAIEGVSDASGRFRIRLPAGEHRVSVIHPEFATASRQVLVPAAGAATFLVELTPSAVQLEAYRVSGYKLEGGLASLMDERRQERSVSEVLGAEQMAKSGDGDAAEALKRVTGLTVVDGKYVYVRGMGQRYSSTLLNDASIPSPEIERRTVPLDLFPTDVIESITVQKSYSPELPGEFGGGTVRISTKGIPDEAFVKASITTTYREGTTGQDGLRYDGGGTDWLGYDDGTRSLPQAVKIASASQPLVLQDPFTGEGYPLEVLEGLGEVMPNVWTPERKRTPPDLGFSLALGDRYETPAGPLGFRVGASYKNGWQQQEGLLRTLGLGGGGELARITDYERETLTNTVDFSTLATIGYQPAAGQELTVTAIWLRRTENQTEVYEGLLSNDDAITRVSSLNFVEQQMMSAQVQGDHTLFADVELDWSYTFAYADRYQPDWRRTRYDLDPARDEFVLSNRPEGNQRLYNDVQDFTHDLSGGLTIPFEVWSNLEAKLAFGGAFLSRDRESETRRFKFIHRGPLSLDPDVLANPAELVFTPQTIGADGFTFEEITRATDSYEAEQTITAAYLRLDLPLHASLDASFGARIERSRQEVSTFNLFSRDAVSEDADLDTTDILPAANLTWRFYEGMQLRGGYSRTLTRPDFRELSSAPFDLVVGAGVFVGNPDLDRTLIDNVDLRWEWYFDSDESVSIGLFYKQLHDPIETVILGGTNRTVTLQNADEGRNLGIEFEFRKRLDFFGVDFMEKFFFAGNLSLIHSDVDLASTGIATNDSRALEGQSPYVINAAFGWDDPDTRTSVSVLYNVAGKRIVGIGTFGLDDIYEQPFHQLDVVMSWGFWEGWTLKLKAENLLDSKVTLVQDDQKVSEYEKGVAFSASLSAEF